jgi:phage shock protein PspC (stress-responsive transcriptional regulator)
MSNLTMPKDDTMTAQTPLPLRNDTILGVCEAIGQEFGFNPLWLRLAFIPPLFFSITMTVAAYLGLGLIVAATRWLAADKVADAPDLVSASNEVDAEADEAMPLAA